MSRLHLLILAAFVSFAAGVVMAGNEPDERPVGAEAAARAYLRKHAVANITNPESQLKVFTVHSDRGKLEVVFRQTIEGIEVLETDVTVRIGPEANVEIQHVDTVENTTLPTLRASISAAEALKIAAADIGAPLTKRSVTDLYILRKGYAGNSHDALAWYVDAVYRNANRNRDSQSLLWIDALTGRILEKQQAPDPAPDDAETFQQDRDK